MARTSGAVTGIAARVAGERFLGIKTNKDAHAGDLKAILGGLKGPMMKVAQFLATIPDALPEEYARELATLQSNAPPMGWAFVNRRMGTELGPQWQSNFAEFGREAAAAASLGQVHRAKLKDGTEVACKLQYPDMNSVVEADLKQLKLGMQLYRKMDSALDNEDAYAEIAERLREELDYTREAAHQRLYGLILADEPRVHVPTPIDNLTTRRLLTMTWLKGGSILKRLDEEPSLEERNLYAEALFQAWYKPVYRYGVIHGDPHLGNYQVRQPAVHDETGGISLLDFGVVRIFPPSFITGVITLYEAVRDGDDDKAHYAFESWGFRNLSRETMLVLKSWADFLYEPLLEDKVRFIQQSEDPTHGRKVAQAVHEGLKRTGGVKIPREFPLMDRAAIGLGSVFFRLKAQRNWHRMFNELIADYSEEKLAQRQAAALAEARVPGPI
ncbi:AarF/ABC1/UbiB kinase family protein [Roseococcus sp. SDR]|uniref:ABC1 kinase family protein n=1 Tax=Roseococcus sp. SDR TaxID=2835532 RepID=UPI001BCE797C|nr:AarF/ABC1/UbiB kinase family protein [Roseococcus sp. SDR]MBS7790814.1 AarF/ABC1/UbiB kinase family protein [Roseococcus sp. SDR]MBV1846128.1 AarF/ABC1/UbiB kinase family protein [Roseococcus sp. SDR]